MEADEHSAKAKLRKQPGAKNVQKFRGNEDTFSLLSMWVWKKGETITEEDDDPLDLRGQSTR